jgi:hypothetical protein
MTRKRRRSASGASSPEHHSPRDAAAIVADPDDWDPCGGHPPRASAGFVGCSPTWPPPSEEGEPRCDSARLAEESAEYGSLEIVLAFAKLERRLAEGGSPR